MEIGKRHSYVYNNIFSEDNDLIYVKGLSQIGQRESLFTIHLIGEAQRHIGNTGFRDQNRTHTVLHSDEQQTLDLTYPIVEGKR